MSDYKDLVAFLRRSYDDAEVVLKAADAIEELVRERDDEREAADDFQHRYFYEAKKSHSLGEELGETQIKLNAAIADLKRACMASFGGCSLCKNRKTEICKNCLRDDFWGDVSDNPADKWEWRGAQKYEGNRTN